MFKLVTFFSTTWRLQEGRCSQGMNPLTLKIPISNLTTAVFFFGRWLLVLSCLPPSALPPQSFFAFARSEYFRTTTASEFIDVVRSLIKKSVVWGCVLNPLVCVLTSQVCFLHVAFSFLFWLECLSHNHRLFTK